MEKNCEVLNTDLRNPVPLFSIIIPVYNRPELLREALGSVMEQSFTDYEVIVIDDGSTGGAAEAVRVACREWEVPQGEKWANGRMTSIKVIRQENKGPGSARNTGATHAVGTYLAFLDSDDLWFPWTLDSYRRVIEEQGTPAFIAGKPFVFKETAELDCVSPEQLQCEKFPDYLASGSVRRWWGVSSFVVRKALFERVGGFATEFINGEDADLVMKCGVEPDFVQVTGSFTFAYRQHAGNITGDLPKNLAGVWVQIRNEVNGVYPGGKDRALDRHLILTRQIRPVAVAALRCGDGASAWEIYRRTFKWQIALRRWKFLVGFPLKLITWKLSPQRI